VKDAREVPTKGYAEVQHERVKKLSIILALGELAGLRKRGRPASVTTAASRLMGRDRGKERGLGGFLPQELGVGEIG